MYESCLGPMIHAITSFNVVLQAFIWYTTLGGYLGFGILRDFVRLPSYVRDANDDEQYVKDLSEKMRKYRKVKFHDGCFCLLCFNSMYSLFQANTEIMNLM